LINNSHSLLLNPSYRNRLLYLIAPYCFDHEHSWYSPGRTQKLSQTESLISSFNINIVRFNTAPVTMLASCPPCFQVCSFQKPFLRIIQTCYSTIFFYVASHKPSPVFIWVYNTRFNEFIVAVISLILNRSARLILQIEDLPFARSQNSGLQGLLDYISLFILIRLSYATFILCPKVGRRLQQLVFYKPSRFSLLPPHLNNIYLEIITTRKKPFSTSKISILYAGGYGPDKGVDDLLAAFLLLTDDRFELNLIGSCPDSVSVLLSDHPNVNLLGQLSQADLYSNYAKADILVSPHHVSNKSDYIFPFKLIEYAASGSLVFTTRMPGADSLGLPHECFYDTVTELSTKLHYAPQLWCQHSESITHAAVRLRSSFCFESVRTNLEPILTDP